MYEKILIEEIVKEYEKVDENFVDMREIYERFQQFQYVEDVKPYLITMQFFGWGTEQNKDNALAELMELIRNGRDDLKGLLFDLKVTENEENHQLLLALLQEEKQGYTHKYLKNKLVLSKWKEIKLKKKRLETSKYSKRLAVGATHTVIMNDKNNISAIGMNRMRQCNVDNWSDIIAVSAGAFNTVGLKEDGSVLFTGGLRGANSPVELQWNDVIDISGGNEDIVGLKRNGAVITYRENLYSDGDISNWSDIIAISTMVKHVVGLKKDGTVVAAGSNKWGECNVSNWKNVVKIVSGPDYTLGLTSDGKVLATQYIGKKYHGQCDVDLWEDIVEISAGAGYSVGIKADGTVVTTEIEGEDRNEMYCGQTDVHNWTDIVAIKASGLFTVGVKSDGTIVVAGDNKFGQCDVDGIKMDMN